MTDAIDEARAEVQRQHALHTWDDGSVTVETMDAAADRYALTYLDAAAAECINCQDTDPEEREELTQQTGHGWCDAHRALRARLEGGSHAD